MKEIVIKKGCEKRVLNGYLWIFSNELEGLKNFAPGETVLVKTSDGNLVGTGYVNPHSLIAVRLLSRKEIVVDEDFFIKRLSDALNVREKLYDKPFYRMVFSEGDFVPGLVIDRYDNVFSLQFNTFWMDKNRDMIIRVLKKLISDDIKIVLKNDNRVRLLETLSLYVKSENENYNGDIFFEENDIKFYVNILKGQKTGYFFDQRENKKLLKFVSRDAFVVDLFSYIGGWGLNALKWGAEKVWFVDISDFALECAKENVLLNKFNSDCKFIKGDAVEFLKNLASENLKPDVLIVDPPAYVKSKKKLNEAVRGYINLNKWAMKGVKKGGFIFTCSCSQHVDEEMFLWIINNAARSAGKRFRVLYKLFQGFDHPVNPKMKETSYLKGLFIQVL